MLIYTKHDNLLYTNAFKFVYVDDIVVTGPFIQQVLWTQYEIRMIISFWFLNMCYFDTYTCYLMWACYAIIGFI